MGGNGKADRLVGRRAALGVGLSVASRGLLDRGLADEPEALILALLQIPYDDPDDPDLARRARLLEATFERVESSRVAALVERLTAKKPKDELSRLFQRKLHTATQKRLLAILSAKVTVHRVAGLLQRASAAQAPAPAKKSLPRVTKKRDYILVGAEPVTRRSNYIDNVPESISRLLLFSNHRVMWSYRDAKNTYEIPPSRVDPGAKTFLVDLYEPHDSYFAAATALMSYRLANPGWKDVGIPVTFYKEVVHGETILMPTLFTAETTPRLLAGMVEYQKLYPLEDQIAGYVTMMKGIGDFVSPVPFVGVSRDGDIEVTPPDSVDDVAFGLLGLKGHMPRVKSIPRIPWPKRTPAPHDGGLPRAVVVKGGDGVGKSAGGPPGGTPETLRPGGHGVSNLRLSKDTAGTGGIHDIRGERRADKSLLLQMEGELLPPIPRDKAPSFEKDLPTGKEAGLPGTERSHMWGPGFGDEARDGIFYAPKEVNQTFQNGSVERQLRELRVEAAKQGATIEVSVKAETYPPIQGHDPLKEASYRFDVRFADGTSMRMGQVDISVPAPGSTGNVEVRVIPGSAGTWSLY